jgi:hypothetical protein
MKLSKVFQVIIIEYIIKTRCLYIYNKSLVYIKKNRKRLFIKIYYFSFMGMTILISMIILTIIELLIDFIIFTFFGGAFKSRKQCRKIIIIIIVQESRNAYNLGKHNSLLRLENKDNKLSDSSMPYFLQSLHKMH